MRSDFEYLRPSNVNEAIAMRHIHGDGAVFWAGGTDLVLQWKSGKTKPTHCIDLTWLDDMARITHGSSVVDIGALVTLEKLTDTEEAEPWLTCLADTARLMCTVQTRTIATVGGNLCNASPAADLVPPLVAMNAEVQIQGPEGERSEPVESLAIGPGKTSLAPSEVVVGLTIPVSTGPHAAAYRRIDRTVVDIALVSASSALSLDNDGRIAEARIALGAVAPTVILAPEASSMLLGLSLKDLDADFLNEVGNAAAAAATPISDVRASAEYRTAMIRVLVARALHDVRQDLREETS